jgi:hypothetical protein
MNFSEIRGGTFAQSDGAGASLWQPVQFEAIGCCDFQ